MRARPARWSFTRSQIVFQLFDARFSSQMGGPPGRNCTRIVGPPTVGSDVELSWIACLSALTAVAAFGATFCALIHASSDGDLLLVIRPVSWHSCGLDTDRAQINGLPSRKPADSRRTLVLFLKGSQTENPNRISSTDRSIRNEFRSTKELNNSPSTLVRPEMATAVP